MPGDLETAATMAGLPPISDGDIFQIPTFRFPFKSEAFPIMDGEVELRFPRVQDDLTVESIVMARGGGQQAYFMALVETCLVKAPASWWVKNPAMSPDPLKPYPPLANVLNLPDTASIIRLASKFIKWRDSFRGGAPAPDPEPKPTA